MNPAAAPLPDALLGATGYVGSTLLRQTSFDVQLNSTNAARIAEGRFDRVVCAAAPAQKWIANRDPAADHANLQGLMQVLEQCQCRQFVLISTVDVFQSPVGVDESSPLDTAGLHPYGRHRLELEVFVRQRFENHLIVRLPGLVGPGLRKNVIFDLLNGNNLEAVDARSVFQFYPMINLWYDIETALQANLGTVHLTAEPICVADVARQGFGMRFEWTTAAPPPRYDMRTLHAGRFGGQGHYQYGQRESVQAIRAYAQSEPRRPPPAAAT